MAIANRAYKHLKKHLEGFVWFGALLSMMLSQPIGDEHFSLCPIAWAGIPYCPGCGLGRSMIFLLNGQFLESLSMHPLGLLAVMVLTLRILKNLFTSLNLNLL